MTVCAMIQVGFPQRDPNRLQLALDHSHSVLWIRSMKQSRWARQGQLLGFARATSDGALSATIWDVAVSCKHCLACSPYSGDFIYSHAHLPRSKIVSFMVLYHSSSQHSGSVIRSMLVSPDSVNFSALLFQQLSTI